MDADDVFARTRANRLLAADMFAGLTPGQWATDLISRGRAAALADLTGDGAELLAARIGGPHAGIR